jgi:hypothetical protein
VPLAIRRLDTFKPQLESLTYSEIRLLQRSMKNQQRTRWLGVASWAKWGMPLMQPIHLVSQNGIHRAEACSCIVM